MEHTCDKCIYKIEPVSIKDYYEKTLKMPLLSKWGCEKFKHIYWLCSNPSVAKVDFVNNSIIHKPCIDYNFHGNCTYFKIEDAEDILPSKVTISLNKVIKEEEETVSTPIEDEPIYIGDEIELEVMVEPFSTPAVTEEKQKIDEEGIPVIDENGEPVLETVVIEEEFINNQDISYSYIWYKNGRKLFQKKSNILKIDTSKESVDEYYCVVTQSIINNGDGGNKVTDVKSDTVVVTIELKEESDETPPEEDDEIEVTP